LRPRFCFVGGTDLISVSVLLTSYNYERYLPEAIESVLNQSFKDLELIIVDDASTDSSRKIIESYQTKDKRVRAFFHEKNQGIARTANDGLSMANGKFISFIGADDVWFPFKLEKQLSVLKNNEDKIVWSEGEIIDGAGIPTGKTMTQLLNSPRKKSGNIFQELLKEDFVFGQSLIFKSEYLKKVKFDENLHYVNDHLLLVNLSMKYAFVFMPEPLAKYRIHGRNVTLKNEKTWLKERILIRKYFLQNFSNQITARTRADIYYKIGRSFSRLGEKKLAKQYYLEAIRIDHLHNNSLLYLILALTDGEGFMGKFLSNSYHKVSSLMI
jgi:glycosyltransferase involved in cell wall biosynthesis